MLSSPFPTFSGGNTELTADMLNLMFEQMRRQSRLIPAAPVLVNRTGEGWQVRLSGLSGVWAVAGVHEGNGRYQWAEAQLGRDGFAERPGGRSGGGTRAAAEVNGREDVAEGEVLYLEMNEGGDVAFVAPLPPGRRPTLTWGRIDEADGAAYGWTEMAYFQGQFVERDGGDVFGPDDPQAAYEVNGQSVAAGSLVVLYAAAEDPDGPRLFEFGGADPGFWAVLLREFTGAVYGADLAGADGGTWSVSFDPGDSPAPGTVAGTATLRADAAASDVQAALDPFTAGDVAVTADGGGFTFTLSGNLVGDSGATLAGDGGGLSFPPPEGGGRPPAFSFKKTAEGRDLPFTDGRGGYAWVPAEFDAFGRLRPKAGATGSVWPVGLALEANAVAVVPEGTVVWARPRTAGLVLRATAEADNALADWTAGEVAARLDPLDAGGGFLADDGIDFAWNGVESFWAELTGGPDANNLYPFRVVHLGGRDKEKNPAAQPPDVTADDLRAARLSGDAGGLDTFDAPLAGTDRAWTASRPGGREVTGLAREILSRRGFAAGTVVRCYANATADNALEFTFTGPPLSFWATLGTEVGPGVYDWTELDPPADPLTGLPAAARTGTAVETTGVSGIEGGTPAYLFPDGDGGWRFRHQSDTAEGGRDCRLLNWTAGSTATIVAGDDAASNGAPVAVQFYPPNHAGDFTRAGHHVGYRPPGKDYYVVVNPFDYHSDRVQGYYSTGGQGVAGQVVIGQGSLVTTGAGGLPPFAPPVAYRINYVANTAEVYNPGYGQVDSSGRLFMSGGPVLTASGGSLDLAGGLWASPTDQVAWVNTSTSSRPPRFMRDGPTGTFTIPGVAGAADGSITFEAGLYVSSVNPGARPATFSGTFQMYDLGFGVVRSVTATDGIITSVV